MWWLMNDRTVVDLTVIIDIWVMHIDDLWSHLSRFLLSFPGSYCQYWTSIRFGCQTLARDAPIGDASSGRKTVRLENESIAVREKRILLSPESLLISHSLCYTFPHHLKNISYIELWRSLNETDLWIEVVAFWTPLISDHLKHTKYADWILWVNMAPDIWCLVFKHD